MPDTKSASGDLPRHRPRKRFGQNFLHDAGTIRRILAAIDAAPGEALIEIGPGRGALTGGLLDAAGALDVVELDRDLVGPLGERFAARGRLTIHNADALRVDLCALPRPSPAARWRVVGNLPYNISTPLLFRFIAQSRCIADLHLMLQAEVVERIVAPPGGKTYGRLSVMVQTYCRAERLFGVAPGAFVPVPKVDSAVLRLVPLDPLPDPLADPGLHARLVAAAFAQRRKTLRNTLRGLLDAEQLVALGIDPSARAETLSTADFARLANAATACNSAPLPGN